MLQGGQIGAGRGWFQSSSRCNQATDTCMCGIAGYIQRQGGASPGLVEHQLRLLDHRGPDAQGVFARGSGAIGQTRLSIIDLDTGDPPISNEDGSIGCVLNGEIYNFRALGDQLRIEGHTLRTRGDTEVLCHLAETKDPETLAASLHGMFAFAIWDHRAGRLTLGRDRLGKKPLYYWSDATTFVFASEIKALLVHPRVPKRLDSEVLPAYLGFGYVPTPRTFFEGVRSVPPGHVATVDADLAVHLHRYWTPPLRRGEAPRRLSRRAAATEVRARLQQAVETRLVADVPLGAFLSGGVDSSAVVAAMASAMSGPVRTFTIGFEGAPDFDERRYARLVADRLGTEHTEMVVKPDSVNLIERLVWHADQPFGDSSAIPTFLLAEMTGAHVKVALSGDGGDEIFAGYRRFVAGLALARLARTPTPIRGALLMPLQVVAAAGPSSVRPKLGRFLDQAWSSMPDGYRSWVSYMPDDLVRDLSCSTDSWAVDDFRRTWAASAGADTLDRLLDLNMRTYLLDDLLPKVDRMSMAHGLEVRSPFLDHEFVQFTAHLPRSARIARLTLKRALKDAMRDELPREILARSKQGFGVPLGLWFREDMSEYVRSRLGSASASVWRYLDGETIKRIVHEHSTGVIDHTHALWALLTLEVFLRQHDW